MRIQSSGAELHVVADVVVGLPHFDWNDSTKCLKNFGSTHRLFHTFSSAMTTPVFSASGNEAA